MHTTQFRHGMCAVIEAQLFEREVSQGKLNARGRGGWWRARLSAIDFIGHLCTHAEKKRGREGERGKEQRDTTILSR